MLNAKVDPEEIAAIQALFPAPGTVNIADGVDVAIRVMNMGQVARLSKLLAPAWQEIRGHASVQDGIMANLPLCIQAVAIAIDWPVARVEGLPTEKFFAVTSALIEKNATYFNEKVAPELARFPKAPATTKDA